jgi:hypothetical protein
MMAALRNGSDGQYRALLLDFGTVIQKSFFETRADIEELLQIPPGTLAWAGPFDPGSDPLWRQVVSGAFPERAYWDQRAREVGRLIGENWTIQDFCRKHGELPPSVILRPEMLALIADAKEAGLKFGILTNELELFWQGLAADDAVRSFGRCPRRCHSHAHSQARSACLRACARSPGSRRRSGCLHRRSTAQRRGRKSSRHTKPSLGSDRSACMRDGRKARAGPLGKISTCSVPRTASRRRLGDGAYN